MTRFILALVVPTAILSMPSEAEACACCDGGAARDVVGWSESGNSALVRMRGIGCEDVLALEIRRRGDDAPAGCFDLYGENPGTRVECGAGALSYGFDRWDWSERPAWESLRSPRQAAYPQTPTEVAASHLRATLTREAPDDELAPTMRLEVFALGARGWVPLFERTLHPGRPDDARSPEDMTHAEQVTARTPRPIEVRVWPSPNGRHALVEVGGQNESPNMGWFPEQMSWVRLPADLAPLPTVAAGDPGGRALALLGIEPAFAHENAEADRLAIATAREVNRAGLTAHRAERFDEAAALFATAAMTDPRDAMSRYNLACAFARLGQEAPALAVLKDLKDSRCPRCAERLRRARQDPDLAALRDRLP